MELSYIVCMLLVVLTRMDPSLTRNPFFTNAVDHHVGQTVAGPIIPIDDCGDHFCTCNDKMADCNGQYTLNYVPRLTGNVTHVYLVAFALDQFTHETFENLTMLHLIHLTLGLMTVRSVEMSALAPFIHLESLVTSKVVLQEEHLSVLLKGISDKPLDWIYLSDMDIQDIGVLDAIEHTPITEVTISIAMIHEVNFEELQKFKFLITLDLSKNYIKKVSAGHPALNKLLLNHNQLTELPNLCVHGEPLFPNLTHLDLSNNWILQLNSSCIQCLRNLNYIDISGNMFSTFQSNAFANFPSLTTIRANDLLDRLLYIQPFAFNNSNIRLLSLQNVGLAASMLSPLTFGGCSNLQHLYMDVNKELSYEFLSRDIFLPLRSLTYISLSRCSLETMPTFLESLPSIKSLLLGYNVITQINSTLLQKLTRMIELKLNNNRLTFDFGPSIPTTIQDNLKSVNLQRNQLICSCNSRWLKIWIERAKNTTDFSHPESLTCINDPYRGIPLLNVSITEESCLLDRTTREIVVATSAVLLLVLVVFPLIYRYRWSIQYLVFMLRYDRHRQHRNAEEEARNFRFDAFVIYDSRDHAWVVRQLMPALEDTHGLRLCLHERDFLAGNLIVDNIVNSITASRKVVAIMSEGFAASEWCQFELSLTHRLTLERGHDLMVVVMLEEVVAAHITRLMYAVLKTTTYIAWPDEERAREAFWNRLAEALG